MKTISKNVLCVSFVAASIALANNAIANERAPTVTVKKIESTRETPSVKIIVGDQQISIDVDRAVEQGIGALTQALGAIDEKALHSLATSLQEVQIAVDTNASGVRENAERIREAARIAADAALAAADKAREAASSIDVNEIRDTVRRAMEEANISASWSYGSGGDSVTKGNPYSSRETREFKQVLGDGTVISRQSTRLLARDSEGRTRQELRQPDGTARIFINDPVARRAHIIDPQKRAACSARFDKDAINDCFKQMRGDWKPIGFSFSPTNSGIPLMAANDDVRVNVSSNAKVIDLTKDSKIVINGREVTGQGVPVPPVPPTPPLPPTPGQTSRDSKVVRETSTTTYEGLRVDVNRSIETIAVGAMGNNRPIESVFERYYSPDLKMTVYSRRSDPRTGESIYRMTEIKRSEPDVSLFRVPSGFSESEGKSK